MVGFFINMWKPHAERLVQLHDGNFNYSGSYASFSFRVRLGLIYLLPCKTIQPSCCIKSIVRGAGDLLQTQITILLRDLIACKCALMFCKTSQRN
jgi:hypothetical protein